MTERADALEGLLRERHSCRSFAPQPVDDAIIVRILEMAQRSVSSNNSQPWDVIVTRGAGTERFRDAFFAEAESAMAYHGRETKFEPDFPEQRFVGRYKDRRRECGGQLFSSLGISRDEPDRVRGYGMQNFLLFGAPHAALITTDVDLGPFGAVDCGAYIQSFLLAAQSLGVATIAQGSFARLAPFMRRYFGLPESRLIVCGISFGYSNKDAPVNTFRTSRAPLADIVTWWDS